MILAVLTPRFRSWFKASKIYVGRIRVAWDCALSNWLLLECFVLPSLFASFKYSSILTCLCDSVRVNSNVWHLTKRQSSQLELHCGPAGAVAWDQSPRYSDGSCGIDIIDVEVVCILNDHKMTHCMGTCKSSRLAQQQEELYYIVYI